MADERQRAGGLRTPLTCRRDVTPKRTALVEVETGWQLTFEALGERTDKLAAALRDALSIRPDGSRRPRVGLLFRPSLAFVSSLHAVWALGWTPVCLHVDLTADERSTQAEAAALDALVYGPEFDPDSPSPTCRTVAAETLLDGATDGTGSTPAARWERDETALVLFTSGTTGEPSGVRLTFANLLASADASAFRLGTSPSDRWLCCLPVSHMGGLAPVVRTARYGTALLTQREFDPGTTASALSDHRVSHVSLVPTQLRRLLEAGWTPGPALQTVLLGGAPATETLLERALDAGVPVHPTYGMTEAASQIATALPGEVRDHPGTAGNPLVCTEVRVLDDDEPVDPGTRGEIVVDGPTVSPGYLEDEHTARAFGEYGLHTGDLGYRDEAGRLYVEGRLDDVILTGGELVSPREVADALRAHADVSDAAVVGVPDEEWGERVEALVVPEPARRPGEGVLREHCRGRLARFKVPKRIAFADELPRTGSGTVDRETVRELLA